ncbi:MAG: hypothetical protein AB2A00_13395 [Myxococcota bacterium]
MVADLKKLPEGVNLSPFAVRVFQVMARYTAFPWPILLAQCKRCNLDPGSLTPAQAPAVIPHLAAGVGRFTSPEKQQGVQNDLEALLR